MTNSDFAELYTSHFDRIALQLQAYTGDHTEAQDLVQEAFCRAYDRWARICRYDDPSGWVRRVAWNLATTRLRRRLTLSRILLRQRIEPVAGPEPDHIALTQALAALPRDHRMAVIQHHIGRVSTAEIARQEGVAEGTVRSWLSRGRNELAEQFREFESAAASQVRAGRLNEVDGTVRRRRRNRLTVAAVVVALAILIPVLSLNMFRAGQNEPTTPPSTSPSPSSPPASDLPIVVPGADLPVQQVSFVDRQHGWAHLTRCQAQQCDHAVASTTNGGQSWQLSALPAQQPRATMSMYPLNATTAAFYVLVSRDNNDPLRSFLLTTDGGQTFRSYPYENPPIEVLAAAPDGERGSQYRVRCPGANGYEDGANGIHCASPDLVKLGAGAVQPRPPLLQTYGGGMLKQGADGRLWLISGNESRTEIAFSTDQGTSWQSLPPIENPSIGLALSPNGQHAWYISKATMARLVNGQWQEQPGYPTNSIVTSFVPLDSGAVVISYQNTVGILANGAFQPFDIAGTAIEAFPDGSYSVLGEHFLHLGTPGNWHRLTWS